MKSKARTDVETKRAIARSVRAGEVTQAAAAHRLGVSPQSVRRWVERFGRASGRSAFVAVDLAPASSALVEIGLARGRTLRVPLDVGADELGRLVRVLESAC